MSNVRHIPRESADDDDFTRVPPQNTEAEQSVLGSCIHYPKEIPTVAAVLTGADFYRPAHEAVWNALVHLHQTGQPTTPAALTIELERRGDLKRAGGAPYVSHLADHAGADPLYFAEKVRGFADLRHEAELGRRIIQQATAADAEPGSAVTFIDDYLKRQQERSAGRSGDPADAMLAELLDASGLDNMPTLEPLVGDLLHLDSLARVVGPSGHMKSFMVIDFAGHVGTGMKWHGHHVRQGTVVYLVAEGARGIRKRVRAWEKHHGIKMTDVLFLPRPVQAMSPEWDTLIEAMRRLEPSMIVIDTQARVSVGVEENSAKELGLVVDRMEQLRAATAACVLVIHHTGHVGEHGRGSSSAKGALQSELHVSKKGDNAKNIVVTLKIGKQKDDEESGDLQFGLKVIALDGEAKPDGRPVTSVVLESLDVRPAELVKGTPEWLVTVLDRAQVSMKWGSPRVHKWCAEYGIQMRKDKIEEAVRLRKRRDSFDEAQMGTGDDIPGAQIGTDAGESDEPPTGVSDSPSNTSPQTSPAILNSQLPHDLGGRSGEFNENPRSNLPPQTGGGQGEAQTAPPSPRPSSREGGGAGEPRENTPPTGPPCTICDQPMTPDWANRGYDTHIGCDPTTGSHPHTPQDDANNHHGAA